MVMHQNKPHSSSHCRLLFKCCGLLPFDRNIPLEDREGYPMVSTRSNPQRQSLSTALQTLCFSSTLGCTTPEEDREGYPMVTSKQTPTVVVRICAVLPLAAPYCAPLRLRLQLPATACSSPLCWDWVVLRPIPCKYYQRTSSSTVLCFPMSV